MLSQWHEWGVEGERLFHWTLESFSRADTMDSIQLSTPTWFVLLELVFPASAHHSRGKQTFHWPCAVFSHLRCMSQIPKYHKLHLDLHSLQLESEQPVHKETTKLCQKGRQWAVFHLNWTKTRLVCFFSWKESELLQKAFRRKKNTLKWKSSFDFWLLWRCLWLRSN